MSNFLFYSADLKNKSRFVMIPYLEDEIVGVPIIAKFSLSKYISLSKSNDISSNSYDI